MSKRFMLSLTLMAFSGLLYAEPELNSAAENATTQLTDARQCTHISARFERLACFDHVFNTPTAAEIKQGQVLTRTAAWQRAVSSEKQRLNKQGFAIFYHDQAEVEQGVWITATALDRDDNKAILMLSCFDNITRLELVLPEPIRAGKANVTVAGKTQDTQRWLSDETGTILRPGRGIPAIAAITALLSLDKPSLRTDLVEVNGLTFDASELNSLILPLRKACHW